MPREASMLLSPQLSSPVVKLIEVFFFVLKFGKSMVNL